MVACSDESSELPPVSLVGTIIGTKWSVDYDNNKNYNAPRGENFELSTENSRVKVVIIPTNEELVIARETQKLVK